MLDPLPKNMLDDTILYFINDTINALIYNKEFDEVDHIISIQEPGKWELIHLIGILTVTLPAKDKLPSRAGFYLDVERQIEKREEYPGLLSGLE